MTIKFTQPGDVATQVYNEARRDGATHKEAVALSWQAMQHAKQMESDRVKQSTEQSQNGGQQ